MARSARIVTLPSALNFRTRGAQSLGFSVCVYSNTNTSLSRTATPVGVQGRLLVAELLALEVGLQFFEEGNSGSQTHR